MTLPGPLPLGRGIVLPSGAAVPAPWSTAERVVVDDAIVEQGMEDLLERLHRAWVQREPLVIEWALMAELPAALPRTDPVWSLNPGFLFSTERLRFLAFSNNYDARDGAPRWWWADKAVAAVGATPSSVADVCLPDGVDAWIDGGPRQNHPSVDSIVVSGESIEIGSAIIAPREQAATDDGLATDQLDAVHHGAGPARVIAPAGSGKTRTLAARYRHLVLDRHIEPQLIVALAYNSKAAAELRERVLVEPGSVRTIHSLGWAILREARGDVELIQEGEVRRQLSQLVAIPKRPNTDPLAPYLEALDEVRSGLRDPAEVESSRDDVPGFAEMFDRYRSRLASSNRADFGEQVYGAIEALVTSPELRRRWQHRCRHVLVDEFQDLTPAYLLLIRLVASPRLQVFGVGDDDQVIYGYAGASPEFLIDFDHYFPGAGHHALETNYRCPAPVVDAAVHLLSYNTRRIEKTIHAGPEAIEADEAMTVECREGGSLATVAADRIESWLEAGVRPRDIAVLGRVNAALIPVKAALAQRDIATTDLLDANSLQRTTLRAAFAWIRIGLDPDEISRDDALEAVRRPGRGLTTVARELLNRPTMSLDDLFDLAERLDGRRADKWARFCDDLVAVADVAGGGSAAATLRMLIHEIGLTESARTLDAGRGNASRSAHVDDLVAIERAAHLHESLDDFIPWLSSHVSRRSDPAGVTLSSVHRVKGMEWPRIIVFGADRGSMPHDLATDTEEERRVFHVAITRSMEQTVVLADKDRPSRFLDELTGTAARPKAPAAGASRRPVAAAPTLRAGDRVAVRGGYEGLVESIDGRSALVRIPTGAVLNVPVADLRPAGQPEGTAEADLALVDTLRTWRRETSQRIGVPAYVVFNDATMTAIAEALPTDERALIAVPGIGAAKLESYGDEIIALVEAHLTGDDTGGR